MRITLIATGAAAAMALAACGGQAAAPGTTPTATPSPEQSQPGPAEGSVQQGAVARYPDGSAIRIVPAQVVASKRCYEISPDEACIVVGVTITNEGTTPLNFGQTYDSPYPRPSVEVLYGDNRTEAENTTYFKDPDARELPERCMPGTTVSIANVYQVPRNEVSNLTVRYDPGHTSGQEPYLFTGVVAASASTPAPAPKPTPTTTAASPAARPTPTVWMWAQPIVMDTGMSVDVYARPSTSSPVVGSAVSWTTRGTPIKRPVAIVCSVQGETVTYYGEDGSVVWQSSNWDYVTSPAVGWVPDVFLDTRSSGYPNGAVAPRC